MASFKVLIFERKDTVEGVSNALRFATEKEASDYEYDLSMRWFGYDHAQVVECDDPVTDIWDEQNNKAVRLTTKIGVEYTGGGC